MARLKAALGPQAYFYRLIFNIVSAVTLIPLALFEYSLLTDPVFRWQGVLLWVRLLMLGLAFLLFALGAAAYDLPAFLGVRQLRGGHEDSKTLGKGLRKDGILGVVRHPWYSGSILLIWAWDLCPAMIVSGVVLTAYVVIGAWLEERKLVAAFGDEYRRYQEEVSMLVPLRWLRGKFFFPQG